MSRKTKKTYLRLFPEKNTKKRFQAVNGYEMNLYKHSNYLLLRSFLDISFVECLCCKNMLLEQHNGATCCSIVLAGQSRSWSTCRSNMEYFKLNHHNFLVIKICILTNEFEQSSIHLKHSSAFETKNTSLRQTSPLFEQYLNECSEICHNKIGIVSLMCSLFRSLHFVGSR